MSTNRSNGSIRVHRTIATLVAISLLAACTGDKTGQPPSTVGDTQSTAATAAGATVGPRSEFCQELDAVRDESAASARAVSAAGEGTLEALILTVGAFGDIQVYVSRLGDVAPSAISADLEAIESSFDTDMSAAVDNPLGAIARGLVQGLLTQNSFARVDEYATAECGYPVFGAVALGEAVAEVTPRVGDDGSIVIDPANVAGERACEGEMTPLRSDPISDGLLTVRCGSEAVMAFDTDTWEMVWEVRPSGQEIMDADSGGGVMAAFLREYTAATGLTAESETFHVEAFDVSTGDPLWERNVEVHPQEEVISPQSLTVRINGVSPNGTVVYQQLVDYNERLGAVEPRLWAVDRNGKDIWSAQYTGMTAAITNMVSWATQGVWLEVVDDERYETVVNIDSGRIVYRAPTPSTQYNTYFRSCSSFIVLGEGPLVDGRTGAEYGASELRDVIGAGVLSRNDSGLSMIDPEAGGVAWTIPDQAIAEWKVIDGALVVLNRSGEYILVDPETGEEQQTISPDPDVWDRPSWITVDDGHAIYSSGGQVRVQFDAWPSSCDSAYRTEESLPVVNQTTVTEEDTAVTGQQQFEEDVQAIVQLWDGYTNSWLDGPESGFEYLGTHTYPGYECSAGDFEEAFQPTPEGYQQITEVLPESVRRDDEWEPEGGWRLVEPERVYTSSVSFDFAHPAPDFNGLRRVVEAHEVFTADGELYLFMKC